MCNLYLLYNKKSVVKSVSDGIINILGLQNATNGEIVEIFKIFRRKFHMCFILKNKDFLNKVSNGEIKQLKFNNKINDALYEKNKNFYNYYYSKGLITKYQHKALSSNNSKIWLTLNHSAHCITVNNELHCLTETSYNIESGIPKPLDIKEILEGNESTFHNVDRLYIKEHNSKYYVMGIWKIKNTEVIKHYEEVELNRKMTKEEMIKFEIFLNQNIKEFNQNKIDITDYHNTIPLLETISNYNKDLENNFKNLKKDNEI